MAWLRALWTQIWITLVVAAVALALYTSLGRQLIPLIETYRADLEQQLTQALGQPVTVGQLNGSWNRLSPVVELRDINFGPTGDGISVRHVEAELDVSASLFYRLPVFSRIVVDGVASEVHHLGGSRWRIGSQWNLDFSSSGDPSDAAEQPQPGKQPLWLSWLQLQQSIQLADWHVVAFDPQDTREVLTVNRISLRSQGNRHEFDSHIDWGREQVASIRAMASLEGQLWPWKDQNGELYLDVQSQEWSRWIPDQLPSGLHVKEFSAGAEAWLSIRDGDLSSMYLDADVPLLNIDTSESPLQLHQGKIEIAGEHNGEDWHLQVRPQFAEGLPFNDFSLSSISLKDQKGWQIGIPSLDIAAASQFIENHGLLPAPFDRYISQLQAQGNARDVHLSAIAGTPWKIDVRATLEDVTTSAYRGIPAFDKLSGKVHLQPSGGVLDVENEDFRMLLTDVYDQPWNLKQATGRFYWSILPDYARLEVTGLSGYLAGSEESGPGIWPVSVELGITLPRGKSPKESALNLMVGMPEADAALRYQLVPAILSDGIRDWVNNGVTEGHFTQSAFVMRRPLHTDPHDQSQTAQLYLNFDKARVKYLPDWPAAEGLSGHMLLRSPQLDVHLDSGQTLGGKLVAGSGRVTIRPDRRGNSRLTVNARLQGSSNEALRYFTETPLQSVVSNALDQWQASGDVNASLQLKMPLEEEGAEPDIRLQADIRRNQLQLTDLNLQFDNLNGRINYTTAKGLESDSVTGQIFGDAFSGRISSEKHGNGFDIALLAQGQAKWQDFRRWLPTVLLDPLSGYMAYDARLDIAAGGINFNVKSLLQGTQINLPFPYHKSAEDPRDLTVQVQPGDKETRINLIYDNRVRAALALDDKGLNRGQIYLGETEPFLPSDRGLEIRGHIDETLQADDWWGAWQHMIKLLEQEDRQASGTTAAGTGPSSVTDASGPVRLVDVSLAAINLWGTPSGATHVTGTQKWNEWLFNIDSELAKGKITLYPDNRPIDLDLDYIHMPPEADKEVQVVAAGENAQTDDPGTRSAPVVLADPLADIEPSQLPTVNLNLAELYLGTRNFGHWKVESRPLDNGLHLQVLDSDTKGLQVKGDVFWEQTNGVHKTRLDMLTLHSDDVGRIQRAFRQEAVIEAKDMNGTLQLSWSGSPLAFNVETLHGLASLRMKDGTMAAEGAGALKAFGALNFNAIARRLTLDFSDLYQKGVAFDVFKGKVKIEGGLMTFTEPMTMDGPGGTFLTSGSTDLSKETLDMKMVVTFPVSSTLPVVALLAGLAPPVAASIYVTEKLIGDELERFTSARYNVKGTWQEPDLKIDQAFNDDIEGKKKKRGFWRRIISVLDIFNLMDDEDEE